MASEKTMTVKPYDYDVADDVYSVLFYGSDKSTEDGLMEIPAASYQIIVSALELMLWEVHGQDRDTMRETIATVSMLKERQKERERMRYRKEA